MSGRLVVQKYGGTSVGDLARIQGVAERIKATLDQGDRVAVVVSAMSGETNRLVGLAHEISEGTPLARELDVLTASGEQVSTALLAMALGNLGVKACSLLAFQIAIRTDDRHGKARIQGIDTERMLEMISLGIVPIVAGFQGVSPAGDVTTLGRGGSDTSAVALAAALEAEECEICTDVDGVYTADPRVVENPRRLANVTFEEMLELASLGSKVLHPRSVEYAGRYKVPLRVVSTFAPGPGTLITLEETEMEQPLVSGIAHTRDEAKIVMTGVPDIPGIASLILGPVSAEGIEVDMIVQNTSVDGLTDFTFTVKREDFDRAVHILEPVKAKVKAKSLVGDKEIAKVSIVGVGMRSHAGVASRMFERLAQENINIQMISTSEIKVSIIIAERYMELAVRALHTEFDLQAEEV